MTSAEPISVVMIGCGKFSRRYHVPTLEADPGVTLAGIFDPSPERWRARAWPSAPAPPSSPRSRRCPRQRERRWPSSPRRTRCTADHVAFALQRGIGMCCATSPSSCRRSEPRRSPPRPTGASSSMRSPSTAASIGAACARAKIIRAGGIGAGPLRRDGSAGLREQRLVPGACAWRRRAVHGPRNPHGRHRAVADRAPADARARPRPRRQRARALTAAASSNCCSATSNAT